MLVGGKEYLHQLKDTEVNYVVLGKPQVVLTNTRMDNLPLEVQDLLNEDVDIIVDDFLSEISLVRRIRHHIHLIP